MTIATSDDGRHTGSDRVRRSLVVEPGAGEVLDFLGGSRLVLKLADPSEPITFYEYTSEPSVAGAPQHLHERHDETFYVVEGTYEFGVGDDTVVLSEGGFVSVPAGTPHSFRNVGASTGRIIGTFNSPSFANYFRELADIIRTTGGPPHKDDWSKLYARYDTRFRDDATNAG